ncbi:hypothetical protein [Variovorax brevis]|uniref:hypothetical protein n=1 Tax=Variovorax brevis TaxID=3053503 RepID=UPI00336588BB
MPVTVPSSLLIAETLVLLNALLKVAVDELLTAADLSPSADAEPESLFVLLSAFECVLESVFVTVFVRVLESVAVFVPPSPLSWSPVAAYAAPANPNANAIAEASSVFFMKSPGWLNEQEQAIDLQ